MMRTYKGIVCEKKTEYMVFLTKEGEFLRGIPIGYNPEIGDEAEFHLFEVTRLNVRWMKPSLLTPVLVAAVLLLFVVASFIPNQNTALAYVQIDGKSAVELGVDKNGQVVTLRSLNERTPINLEDWEGHPLDFVLEKAVKQMSLTTEELAITTVYENNKQSSNMRKIIEVAVSDVQNQHSKQVLIIKESTIGERKKANKHNTSIQKLKEKDQHFDMESKIEDKQRKAPNQSYKEDDDDNEEHHTPSKETNKASDDNLNKEKQLEKELEKREKEQEKLKEEIKEQKEKEEKEIEKQLEKIEKDKEKEAKEQEKERGKEEKAKEKEQEKDDKD